MSEIILHHYESSPFSEKIRLAFGLKKLAWRSVLISNIMPRPDLMPLTGGYRRTPVMQIGAEIFCDSQCILWALEQRYPAPTLFPNAEPGAAWALSQWTDRQFFQASVAVIFGGLPEGAVDPAFLSDREQLTGRPFDLEQMKKASSAMAEQWRGCASLIDSQLVAQESRGAHFLFGERPGLGDLSAHMNYWFLRSASHRYSQLMAEFPRTLNWLTTMDGIGHGVREEMSSGEALQIAVESPAIAAESKVDPAEPNGWRVGQRLAVSPDDYGKVPVTGELVSSSSRHIALRRQDPAAGEVVVYFPRLGYVVMPA